MRYLLIEDPPQQIIDYVMTFESKLLMTPPTEVTREGFAKLLKEKGYRSKAPETIQKFCDKYKITPIRRGKQFFYPVEQINRIPNY